MFDYTQRGEPMWRMGGAVESIERGRRKVDGGVVGGAAPSYLHTLPANL